VICVVPSYNFNIFKLFHLEDHAISLIFIHNWMCYIANKMVLSFNLGLFIYLFKSNILVLFGKTSKDFVQHHLISSNHHS